MFELIIAVMFAEKTLQKKIITAFQSYSSTSMEREYGIVWQFFNRLKKIALTINCTNKQNQKNHISLKAPVEWHHVSIDENPADIGSIRFIAKNLPRMQLEDSTWLQRKEELPKQKHTESTKESKHKANFGRQIFTQY